MRANNYQLITAARAFLLTSLLLASLSSYAQEIDFQSSIDATSTALKELDLRANDCLTALDSEQDSKQTCDDFMAAVDGELMTNYLQQCRVLKNWRDDFVTRTVAENTDASNQDDQEMLRRLVSIEFNCGENTLRTRTQFVVPAFNRLQAGAESPGVSATSLSRQLSEARFKAMENRERQRLLNSVQNQQDRSQLETERQFNALENELIRQQIRNTNRPF